MDKKVIVLAVVVVAIAAAVGLYFVTAGDDPEDTFKDVTDLGAGDYFELTGTYTDAEGVEVSAVIESLIDNETARVLYVNGDAAKLMIVKLDSFLGYVDLMGGLYNATSSETEEIDTYLGKKVCDKYEGTNNNNGRAVQLWVDPENDTIYRTHYNDNQRTYDLKASSVFSGKEPMEAPVLYDEMKPFDQLVPGDFFTIENVTVIFGDEYPSETSDVVYSVDKEAGTITMYSDGELVELTEEQYLAGYVYDTTLPGLTNEGVEVIMTELGPRECNRYTGVDEYDQPFVIMTGVDTNIVYYVEGMFSGMPYNERIIATSFFVGGTPGEAPVLEDEVKENKDLKPGDYYVIDEDVVEEDGAIKHTQFKLSIYEIDGDNVSFVLEDNYANANFIRDTADNFMRFIFSKPDANQYDAIETAVVQTEFGDRVCRVYTMDDEIHAIIGLDSDICYYYSGTVNGTVVSKSILSESSVFVGGTPGEVPVVTDTLKDPKDLEAGDEVSYGDSLGEEFVFYKYKITEIDASKDIVTYVKSYSSGERETGTCTVKEFQALAMRTVDPSLELTQKEIFYSTNMGSDRLCTAYYLGDQLYMVIGVDSGICYQYAEFENGKLVYEYHLFTSIIVGMDHF